MTRRTLPRRARILALVGAAAGAGALAVAPSLLGLPGGAERYTKDFEPHSFFAHDFNRARLIQVDRDRRTRCGDAIFRSGQRGRCPAVPGGGARSAGVSSLAVADTGTIQAQAVEQEGRWNAPFPIPVIAINSVVLATGKVLWFAYPRGDLSLNEATAYLWDPATGATRQVDPPTNPATGRPYNIWCAGQAVLADGRVLVAGGNLEYPANGLDFEGLNVVLTFDPFSETWTKQPDMQHGRWYPTVTALPDGRAIIYNGYDEQGLFRINQDVEVFTPSASPTGVGSLSLKPTARRYTELYPHMFVVPGGKVLQVGPDQTAGLLDTTSWTWTNLPVPPGDRIWGSAVLMPSGPSGPAKVMMIGGTDLPESEEAAASTITLDLANPGAGWQPGPSMAYDRSHLNTTILPDGSLLTVGGGSRRDQDLGLYAGPIYAAERLAPGAGSWAPAGTETEERTYHSTAVLLPDGRVVSAGDDRPGQRFTDTAEIYEPPYLFAGTRPAITFAPTAARYGVSFRVAADNPAAITKAVLIRPGAATHANDMDQRSIELAMTTQADGLTLTTPANPTLAPPGYYMLFLLNAQGVPSVAKFVRLDPNAPDTPPLPGQNAPPSASFGQSPAAPVTGGAVKFTDTSTDSDGTIASRGWDLDDDGQFDDGTGKTASRSFPAIGTYTVRLRVTDDDGAPSVASKVVTVSPRTGVNLLPNPSFEANVNGWFNYQLTIERVKLAGAPAGSWVAKMTQVTGDFYTLDDSPDTVRPATAGHVYTARAMVRAAASSSVGTSATITIRERAPDNSVVGRSEAAITLTNAFRAVTVTRTVAASGNTIDVYVGQTAAVAGNAFYADQISLTRQ